MFNKLVNNTTSQQHNKSLGPSPSCYWHQINNNRSKKRNTNLTSGHLVKRIYLESPKYKSKLRECDL